MSEICPVCGSSSFILDEHRGELYCSKCGYVLRDNITWEEISEIHSAGQLKLKKHVNYHLGSNSNNSIEEHIIVDEIRENLPKEWIYISKYISKIGKSNRLPQRAVESAKMIFIDLYELGILHKRGVNAEALSVIAVYLAGKQYNYSWITLNKLLTSSGLTEKELLISAFHTLAEYSNYRRNYNGISEGVSAVKA